MTSDGFRPICNMSHICCVISRSKTVAWHYGSILNGFDRFLMIFGTFWSMMIVGLSLGPFAMIKVSISG